MKMGSALGVEVIEHSDYTQYIFQTNDPTKPLIIMCNKEGEKCVMHGETMDLYIGKDKEYLDLRNI